MRSFTVGIGLLSLLGAAGCADRFHGARTADAHPVAAEPAGAARLRVTTPPPDLAWLMDGIRLFRAADPATRIDVSRSTPAAPVAGVASLAAMGDTEPADNRSAPPGTDVRFVALPLAGSAAAALTGVPEDVEAAVAPGILPSALRAARPGGQTVALPLAARWMTLAWNSARLEESAVPVPPYLDAWVDQLHDLRERQPEHAPLIVAWGESDIAASFALLLAAHGGRLLDEAGQPAFVTPEGVATVQLMTRLLDDHLVQPTALETTMERLAASLSGPYAYWLCPSDALVTDAAARGSSLRLSGLPMVREHYRYPDSVAATLVQYRAVAVSRDAAQPAAAWRLARFLADPVVLRSGPAVTSLLATVPSYGAGPARQARALVTAPSAVPWPEPPGLTAALGRFLHAALRRLLTPREALERAALQFRQPGALPEENTTPSTPSRPGATSGPSSDQAGGASPESPTTAPGYGPPSEGPAAPPGAAPPEGAIRPPGVAPPTPGPGAVETGGAAPKGGPMAPPPGRP
jgi:ABC-type glycerol-3-phosphate transport system substrate-binding protein